MNKKRRKEIDKIIMELENANDDTIDYIKDRLEDVLYEEQESFECIPDNLKYSLRGEESEEAISLMEDAISSLDEGNYEEAIELLGDIY